MLFMAFQALTVVISLAILTILLKTPHNTSSTTSTHILPKGMSRVNPSTAHQLKPCGEDVETARANGCIFDLLTMAWLAPDCYDSELSDEFLEVASEPFFYD
ncbi:hypothetical protein BGZ60DRAFT_423026, partial [Tricladium varicosporioides]